MTLFQAALRYQIEQVWMDSIGSGNVTRQGHTEISLEFEDESGPKRNLQMLPIMKAD